MTLGKVPLAALVSAIAATALIACSFNEYAQTEMLTDNIDEHRTGCEVDAETLMTGYKQYDANKFYHVGFGTTPEPTNTPSPITDTELSTSLLLEKVWENGCQAGRRDAVGSEQATLMSLRDQFDLLSARLEAIATSTPTPIAAP